MKEIEIAPYSETKYLMTSSFFLCYQVIMRIVLTNEPYHYCCV